MGGKSSGLPIKCVRNNSRTSNAMYLRSERRCKKVDFPNNTRNRTTFYEAVALN